MLASLSLSLFAASVAQAATILPQRLCGTSLSDQLISSAEAHFADHAIPLNTSFAAPANAAINVYWHIISKDSSVAGGNVPRSQIDANMKVLNDGYAGTGLTFNIKSIDRTVNANWFNKAGPDTSEQTSMKRALRKGGPADLNLYTVGFASGSGQGLLGYATFPWSYLTNSRDDGVVFLYSSVPGGSSPNYNGGQTLTHEVGHWVGLYHTFQGGCSSPGDYVDDTAPEAEPVYGCPASHQSCGSPDPFNNFMDYSYDACMTEFTSGQVNRLQSQMATYRGVSF